MKRTALIKCPAVEARAAVSRSTLYARINEGMWPKPVSIGRRCVAWPEYEVDAMNAARVAGWSDAEIKRLVSDLEAARKSVTPHLYLS